MSVFLILKYNYVILFKTFTDSTILENLLADAPDQAIKFKVYKREQIPEITIDRRLTRVRNQNRLPIGVWAHWIVESILVYTYLHTQIYTGTLGLTYNYICT